MRQHPRTALAVALAGLAIALATTSTPVGAKLSAAPDDDGLTDPETEAEVDALNEALEPPEAGETWEEWEAEFEAAYEALYGSNDEVDPVYEATDMCLSPVSDWVNPESEIFADHGVVFESADLPEETFAQSVVDALGEPAIRTDLIAVLEAYLSHQLAIELAGVDLVSIGAVNIGLGCHACAMTYVECLLLGNPWDLCKRQFLNCPPLPESSLTITIPVRSPVRGTITLYARASLVSSRLEDVSSWCINLDDYSLDGLTGVQGMVSDTIDEVFADGFCRDSWLDLED